MKRYLAVALFGAAAACSDGTSLAPSLDQRVGATIVDGDIVVTTPDDAGPGSFRDAIAQANGNSSIQSIAFAPGVNTIRVQSGIVFSGTQDLTINANHATIDGSAAGGTALSVTGGGDLTVVALTVMNTLGDGISYAVPAAATGTINISLRGVDAIGNAGFGVLINDQNDPNSLDPSGSAASLHVVVEDSRFLRNGNTAGVSVSDRDGLRVNEGGAGNLTLVFQRSRAEDNGADGIELDERDVGSILIDVSHATVVGNGPFDPADLDDGFDIDEAGDGDISGSVVSSVASHNYEEGLDFNENDAGELLVNLTDVTANYNGEEGVDYEEDDDFAGGGDLVTVMDRITTIGNGVDGGDGGLKIREKGAGNLRVTLTNVISAQNAAAGIHLRETEAGDARVSIDQAVTNGNGPNHGIEIRESSSGSIVACAISNVTASANALFGVSAENGTCTVPNVKGGGNGGGLTGGGALFVVP